MDSRWFVLCLLSVEEYFWNGGSNQHHPCLLIAEAKPRIRVGHANKSNKNVQQLVNLFNGTQCLSTELHIRQLFLSIDPIVNCHNDNSSYGLVWKWDTPKSTRWPSFFPMNVASIFFAPLNSLKLYLDLQFQSKVDNTTAVFSGLYPDKFGFKSHGYSRKNYLKTSLPSRLNIPYLFHHILMISWLVVSNMFYFPFHISSQRVFPINNSYPHFSWFNTYTSP